MNGPSDLYIVAVLILSWVIIAVFSWQVVQSFTEKTVRCPWTKCRHNKDCICQSNEVDLKLKFWDDHMEGLRCNSFEQGEQNREHYNKIV